MPTARHSSLTGDPSGIPMFCSFSRNWGGCFFSFSKVDVTGIRSKTRQGTGHITAF